MNARHFLPLLLAAAALFTACGGGDNAKESDQWNKASADANKAAAAPNEKGVGKFQQVELTHPLDPAMIKAGQSIYDVKCASCHKTTGEKLVGPGWKGVTDRRAPEWILNFVTNTDEMLNKDPESQAMLEVCMVRMPNQNLKDDEARQVLEFMRHIDGKN